MTPPKLLRVVEIAKILGVSKQRADQLRREPDFPAPVDRWARGDLCGPRRTFDDGREPTRSAQDDGVPEGDALSDSNEIPQSLDSSTWNRELDAHLPQ
jgi:hypothetical protein